MGNNEQWKASYRGVLSSVKLYILAYGGWSALFRSPYLHLAAVVALSCVNPWWKPDDKKWHELIVTVVPNLLGFTLGGYAVLLAFGDEKFRRMIGGKAETNYISPFMKVNGTFVHFIVVQAFCLMIGVIGNSIKLENIFFSFVGFFAFYYVLLTAVAAAMALLRLAKAFDLYLFIEKRHRTKKEYLSRSYPCIRCNKMAVKNHKNRRGIKTNKAPI